MTWCWYEHLIGVGLGDGIGQQLDPLLIVHGQQVLGLFRDARMKQEGLVERGTYRLGVAQGQLAEDCEQDNM